MLVFETSRRRFESSRAHQLIKGGCYDIAKRNKGTKRLTINGVSKRFRDLCKIFEIFSKEFDGLLYDDQQIIDLYNKESYGSEIDLRNGYFIGKKWMNVNVAMWKEDLELGLLFKHELYSDEKYPHWWLDSVL